MTARLHQGLPAADTRSRSRPRAQTEPSLRSGESTGLHTLHTQDRKGGVVSVLPDLHVSGSRSIISWHPLWIQVMGSGQDKNVHQRGQPTGTWAVLSVR